MLLSCAPKMKDQSSGSGYSIAEPVDYIQPSLQDFILTDLDFEKVRNLNVDYLKEASAFPCDFPVSGW
jgi:hypothetical protein